jgi:methylglutaconyl-CoA hydratase
VTFERILYTAAGGVTRLTLNRPEKRNALDARLVAGMREALAAAGADPGARVVLVAGAGADFCAGADLVELRQVMDAGAAANLEDARRLAGLLADMRHHRLPLVAAVRGRALAGGCGLATACDIILATETAEFGYPEIHLGFVPAMVLAILRRSVPEKRAFSWIATGRRIPAREAHEAGLVDAVFPEAAFAAEVEAYVSALAARPPAALQLAKSLLYQMDGLTFDQALEAGAHANALARLGSECRAGIDRFLKKA